MNKKLLYIGKSNKLYTHNIVYNYYGLFKFETLFNITIVANKNQLDHVNNDYVDYFCNNFKFITDDEYNQIIRKNKLKKISNS